MRACFLVVFVNVFRNDIFAIEGLGSGVVLVVEEEEEEEAGAGIFALLILFFPGFCGFVTGTIAFCFSFFLLLIGGGLADRAPLAAGGLAGGAPLAAVLRPGFALPLAPLAGGIGGCGNVDASGVLKRLCVGVTFLEGCFGSAAVGCGANFVGVVGLGFNLDVFIAVLATMGGGGGALDK